MSEATDSHNAPWMLPRIWGASLLLLIAVTYPLWFPSSSDDSMPLVPLARAIALPGWTSLAVSVGLIGALVVVIVASRLRAAWLVVTIALASSFLLDQHRLQPWAYQSAIYALLFASMNCEAARRWMIPLAASVYVYSAAGKLDYQFAHTVGQDFVDTLAGPLGGIPDQWDQPLRARIALLFPATELTLGLALLIPRARVAAACGVILMHLSLIAILGPWGLGHSLGVLVWNALLIVQAYWLMIHMRPRSAEPAAVEQRDLPPSRVMATLARGVVLVALIAPLSERWGYWDHWPSWSLYSPHTSRVEIEIHRSSLESFPSAARAHFNEDANGDGWMELNTGEWSLQSRLVPIYPQGRYQLQLSAEIASKYNLDEEIRVRVKSVSDRWSGKRKEQLLLGSREIQRGLEQFWLSR